VVEYDARLSGNPATLAPIPRTRYRDFVAADQKAAGDAAHIQYWRRIASLNDATSLPGLATPESVTEDANREFVFRRAITADTETALRRVAARLGLPLKSIFFAAHMRALHEVTARPDVVSGLQVNGRLDDEGGDRVLGVLLNIVPVHMNVSAGTWADLVLAAFEAERQTQGFRRFPLAKIQRLAGHDHKLFDVVFNYTDFHVFSELLHLSQVKVTGGWFSDLHSFPLMLSIAQPPGSSVRIMNVTTGIDARLAGTGARLGELAYRALHDIARDPYAPATYTGEEITK
jgi:hypothetical protein